ncbi:baculoviral IAP repeat-containing protein 7-B isoform X2 [Plodia interpunctella]|uniref:baculoviral IAP repeat-containing protein 7-B isoform X2 n=1 Tax=Plodia interpunctella TaxID=58824 RepID=UPI0023687911|nr:baculoviral IAP repeat-containing protein 7-B isoform X2 [Plodia interpunctella]
MPLLVDTNYRNVASNAPKPNLLAFKNHQCESKLANGGLPSPSSSTLNTPSLDKIDNRDTCTLQDVDLRREDERLKTFVNWPVPFLSPQKLARNGFYYLGKNDEVRCAFCKVEIMRWMEGDDPAKDHQRWAPQCPLLRKQNSAGNVPGSTPSTNGRDECGPRIPLATPGRPSPAHPEYANIAARLRTFKDWPRSMPQKPEDLAEAGFYYTGQGDKTKCYYCDGGLKDWEKDDVPWEQHARWFDRCYYVYLVKGRDYVKKVLADSAAAESEAKDETASTSAPTATATTTVTAATSEKSNSSEEGKPLADSKICKICYEEERNICFVPCGHVIACAKCALSTDKCPLCRADILNTLRLYFS